MEATVITTSKGGVGGSTVASILAVTSANNGVPTLIVDGCTPTSLSSILATREFDPNAPEAHFVTENLSVCGTGTFFNIDLSPYEAIFVDAGSTNISWFHAGVSVTRIGVIRNCYLSLKNAVGQQDKCDHYVAIIEPNRALTARDCEDVLDTSVTAVDWSPDVSRAVDAGLLIYRCDRWEWASTL